MRKSILGVTYLILLLSSLPASASLWDIVCVECSLDDANFRVIDTSGVDTSSPIVFPGVSGDFSADFFGFDLIAHDVNFYWNSGTYNFDSIGDAVTPAQNISMSVNPGQVGMHFLFDWHGNNDIDVLAVFDVTYSSGNIIYSPTDVDGNGVVGFTMVEGPFQGADASVNFTVATPVPAALWLFGSGVIGLISVARRKKA